MISNSKHSEATCSPATCQAAKPQLGAAAIQIEKQQPASFEVVKRLGKGAQAQVYQAKRLI